ncbi:hypothetical protein QJS10_CPA01g02548 [Acorus calamus]|uniref:Uncharacterized protein n=1 Tax=Acorus calamus TaxID=4465 RepID=A0AAV9FM50_ACOCL|nr:hypothetical protein QJS10_CPA01g02548 [Acorus calamus]
MRCGDKVYRGYSRNISRFAIPGWVSRGFAIPEMPTWKLFRAVQSTAQANPSSSPARRCLRSISTTCRAVVLTHFGMASASPI